MNTSVVSVAHAAFGRVAVNCRSMLIRNQHGKLPDDPSPCATVVQRALATLATDEFDAVLATRLTGSAKIQEDPGCAVEARSCRERRANQAKESRVRHRTIRLRARRPLVVVARCEAKHALHRLSKELFAMRLDECVLGPDASNSGIRGPGLPLSRWWKTPGVSTKGKELQR